MHEGNPSDHILRMVQDAMKELFDLDAARVVPTARLVEDLSLDSVDAIDLVAKMEEVTGQVFEERNLRKLRTVQDVVAALRLVVKDAAGIDRVPA